MRGSNSKRGDHCDAYSAPGFRAGLKYPLSNGRGCTSAINEFLYYLLLEMLRERSTARV